MHTRMRGERGHAGGFTPRVKSRGRGRIFVPALWTLHPVTRSTLGGEAALRQHGSSLWTKVRPGKKRKKKPDILARVSFRFSTFRRWLVSKVVEILRNFRNIKKRKKNTRVLILKKARNTLNGKKSKVYYNGDTVNLIMMQKIEIRLTLSRLVTQNVCVMGIFYLYLLHLAPRDESLIILKETWCRGKNILKE